MLLSFHVYFFFFSKNVEFLTSRFSSYNFRGVGVPFVSKSIEITAYGKVDTWNDLIAMIKFVKSIHEWLNF